MTPKQKWLLERLLIPAGILPPALKYEDLKYNEELRQKIGNLGFEYFYLLEQDPAKVNSSPIGGKIYAVHAPPPNFEHSAVENRLLNRITNFIIYRKNKIPPEFSITARKSFVFAKKIGSKVITFHIGQFNHKRIKKDLAILEKLEKRSGITAAIEYEGPYILDYLNFGNYYQQLDGSYDWLTDPSKMINHLDYLYKAKKFKICFDTASLIGCSRPIIQTLERVVSRVTHVHLAGSVPGRDLAGEIDKPEIAEVVDALYKNNYSGYITAEVNGTAGKKEEMQMMIYGISRLLGFSFLQKKTIANAQRHIENSCKYLLKSIE